MKRHKNQSEQQPPFQEPEIKNFDDFITYCSIFDPTISTQSGKVIEKAELLFGNQSFRDDLIIYLFNDSIDIDCAIQETEDFVLFICHAPIYSEHPKEYSLKIVEDKFSKKPQLNTSWKKLKNSQVHSQKIYACFRGSLENERFQRWLVIETPTKNAKYAYLAEDIMGYGKTLLEADLEFYKARIKIFTNSQEIINKFIDNKTPLTKQRMFEVCQKIDPFVNPNSVTFAYFESRFFSRIECSDFKLSCQSKNHKFTLEFLNSNITWKVSRFLKVDEENFPVNLEFTGQGKTLQEAFNMCELKYQKCINNNKDLAQMVSLKIQEEMEQEMMRDNRENELFLEDLIAEYGEDIFPDRD
ncbi:MAG: hypothetical protein ACRCU2_10170 [Planktothrix sp.]